MNIISSVRVSESQVTHLEQLIITHNKLTIQFLGKLSPKNHIATHYGTIYRVMGSILHLSSMRYEAFHKLSKNYARMVKSRVNICYTLALKLQLQLCYRLFCQIGLRDSIIMGRTIRKWSEHYSFSNFQMNDSFAEIISWVKVNGVKYNPKCALHLGFNSDEDPIFGVIE